MKGSACKGSRGKVHSMIPTSWTYWFVTRKLLLHVG